MTSRPNTSASCLISWNDIARERANPSSPSDLGDLL